LHLNLVAFEPSLGKAEFQNPLELDPVVVEIEHWDM
jgi:hypothetical protein